MKKIIATILLIFVTQYSISQQIIDGSDLDSISALNIQDLSNFTEAIKSKNFEEAYVAWMSVRERSPDYNEAIYVDKFAGKLMKYKISISSGEDKANFIKDHISLYQEYIQYFPKKTKNKLGDIYGKIAKLKYDNMKLLGFTNIDVFNDFISYFIF